MTIAIIGIGLIGGSIAIECKRLGYEVLGVDNNQEHLERALQLGLIDKAATIDEALGQSDMFCLAMPVDVLVDRLPGFMSRINPRQVVFDVGSTKTAVCNCLSDSPNRSRFVASHPLAGTEFSGPEAAVPELFRNKKNIICEEEKNDEDALVSVVGLFQDMGMQTLFMDPKDHDKHMAYVSHLSHVSAFTLGLTVLDIEEDEKQIFNLASTGFESTARLAKSNPDTWASIFYQNSEHITEALDSYIRYLQEFKKAIENREQTRSRELINKANEIKRVLNGIRLNVVKVS